MIIKVQNLVNTFSKSFQECNPADRWLFPPADAVQPVAAQGIFRAVYQIEFLGGVREICLTDMKYSI